MRTKQRCEVRPRFIAFLSRKSPDIGGVLFLYLDPDLGLKSEYSRKYRLERKVMDHIIGYHWKTTIEEFYMN